MSIGLFLHAIRLVVNNLQDALRISALLYLVPVVASLFVPAEPDPASISPIVLLVALLLPFVATFCGLWMAVGWHRFVLLDERATGWLPPFRGDRLLAYFGYSVLLGLISLPLVLVALFLMGGLAASGGQLLMLLVGMAMFFVVLVVGYRLALVLPAAALAQPLRLGEAWRASSGATGVIIGLALLTALGTFVLKLPLLLFVGPLQPLGIAWDIVTGWFALMVGLSILTTLYGHFVEGRAVNY